MDIIRGMKGITPYSLRHHIDSPIIAQGRKSKYDFNRFIFDVWKFCLLVTCPFTQYKIDLFAFGKIGSYTHPESRIDIGAQQFLDALQAIVSAIGAFVAQP